MRKIVSILILTIFTSCGMQSIPTSLNEVEPKWAEVQNQYKRRSDLIPNLVSTVKGYASHEKETLQAVVEKYPDLSLYKIPSVVSLRDLLS